jgi:hypothetical protein
MDKSGQRLSKHGGAATHELNFAGILNHWAGKR